VPAVEIVSLAGEVRSQDDGSPRASLSGVAADIEGKVYGGLSWPASIRSAWRSTSRWRMAAGRYAMTTITS